MRFETFDALILCRTDYLYDYLFIIIVDTGVAFSREMFVFCDGQFGLRTLLWARFSLLLWIQSPILSFCLRRMVVFC
jgi:hypothetical protein